MDAVVPELQHPSESLGGLTAHRLQGSTQSVSLRRSGSHADGPQICIPDFGSWGLYEKDTVLLNVYISCFDFAQGVEFIQDAGFSEDASKI